MSRLTSAIVRAMAPVAFSVAAVIGPGVACGAVIYTFSGTPGSGPPAGPEEFTYISRGFIGALSRVPAALFTDCTRCAPLGAYFTPRASGGRFGDQIQFSDSNNGGYVYMFPGGAFTSPGQYSTITGWPNPGTLRVQVTDDLAVANAAGFDLCGPGEASLCPSSGISPGEIASVFGSDTIAPTTQTAAGSSLPSSLAGASVTVIDSAGMSRPAPLFLVSPTQIDFLVPPDTALGTATLIVATPTGPRLISTTVSTVRPGIFAANANGAGVPAALLIRVRADGSQTVENVFSWDAANQQWVPKPIAVGTDTVYLLLYGTGIRNGSDTQVTCSCGDSLTLTVTSAGPQSQFPGLDQVNVLLPPLRGNGSYVQLWLTVGGKVSNTVRLMFQ